MGTIICFSEKLSNKQYPIICSSSLYLPAGVDFEPPHPSVCPNLCFVSLCSTPLWREKRISLLPEDKTLRKRSRITSMREVEPVDMTALTIQDIPSYSPFLLALILVLLSSASITSHFLFSSSISRRLWLTSSRSTAQLASTRRFISATAAFAKTSVTDNSWLWKLQLSILEGFQSKTKKCTNPLTLVRAVFHSREG